MSHSLTYIFSAVLNEGFSNQLIASPLVHRIVSFINSVKPPTFLIVLEPSNSGGLGLIGYLRHPVVDS